MSKTERELLLFVALVKYGGLAELTDQELSKRLQITRHKVPCLRERASVKYLIMDTKGALDIFCKQLASAKYDGNYFEIHIVPHTTQRQDFSHQSR